MKQSYIAAAAAAALSAFALSAHAQQAGVELGLLECQVEGGTGFIIGSTKDVKCTYGPADASMAPETYSGVIRKIGLDVGTTGTTYIQWAVLAPSANVYAPGALAGNYVGASAEASAAVGVGANLLVGGSNQTFTLQPLSLQAQTGVNIALGVTDFQLRSVAN
ncbi:DUF992 domain-containing protein [Allomesorhizobium camelthorni]|uniref:DUF992 domain-containing protein n=1 Tax=Allomesorhizobium camelthorni TaxID=475069 RepID=A0A6G4WBV6_9HYPH|nr:DUF992 domain-containing protein [Mesorhizobium camelthorni]